MERSRGIIKRDEALIATEQNIKSFERSGYVVHSFETNSVDAKYYQKDIVIHMARGKEVKHN